MVKRVQHERETLPELYGGQFMKQFCCGDVVPGCKAKFQADDEAALFAQIGLHASMDHGLNEVPPGLLSEIRANIREVNAV